MQPSVNFPLALLLHSGSWGRWSLSQLSREGWRHMPDMSRVYRRATQKDKPPFAHIFPPTDKLAFPIRQRCTFLDRRRKLECLDRHTEKQWQ